MRISHLRFDEFRNFERLEFKPADGINHIFGQNGQGKTNLLEGLYLLAQLKSFRQARPENLIRQGAVAACIRALVSSGGVEHRLQLVLTPGERRLQVDGLKTTAADFLGLVRVILFAPEETAVARGAPAGRRAMIDRGIFLIDSGYLHQARLFRRCLLQRNTLLRSGRLSEREYDLWTWRLAESGAAIRLRRRRYLEEIKPLLQQCYSELSGGKEQVDMRLSARSDGGTEELLNELFRLKERDLAQGQTLAGPHRDDITFIVNGRPLRQYGSQGQQRSFVLAFKCAQLLDYRQRTGHCPVLLLDDINSELDADRRDALFRFVFSNSGQVFLTTTESVLGRTKVRHLSCRMQAGSLTVGLS